MTESSDAFINMVLRKINPEQIVSLRLNTRRPWRDIQTSSICTFTNIISLSLLNPPSVDRINDYIAHFPKLLCLSFWYDNEVNFDQLSNILHHLSKSIKRFKIRCAGILCTHYHHTDQFNQNFTVEYFLLDIGQFSLPSMNESCFLLTTGSFIKSMQSIRCVRLVINKYYLDKILDWNEWNNLVNWCPQLKTATVETPRRCDIYNEQ